MGENTGRFEVVWSRKIDREIAKLPKSIRVRFAMLVKDLRVGGPAQAAWPNYSPLGPEKFHCHLSYRWVACWVCHKKSIRIEVYYVGSRQGAPY